MPHTYEKLLLSCEGGIVSLAQQAEQNPDAVNIFIGLGGTGIDCLKKVKSGVLERVKPDNPDSDFPRYKRIKFLGIDADKKSGQSDDNENISRSYGLLNSEEFLHIGVANFDTLLSNAKSVKMQPQYNWINEKIKNTQMMSHAGAGGVRQAGRFMLVSQSSKFCNKVLKLINDARANLNNPNIIIHVFSGLSGGTGSGTFLDVCYLTNHMLKQIPNSRVYGYFFMPDINLDDSRIPLSDANTREYVKKNGYAAMQDLDYCMRIQENGGEFQQEYDNGLIVKWNTAPVDLCHLIAGVQKDGNTLSDAYDYALSVTSEYAINFVIKSNVNDFDIKSHLSNYVSQVGSAIEKRKIGVNSNYCTLGGAYASIPMREINTYLATGVFKEFASIKNNLPDKQAIDDLLSTAKMGSVQSIIDELSENGVKSYFEIKYDYKTTKESTIDPINKDINKQFDKKTGQIETLIKSMLDPGNFNSVISKIKRVLDSYCADLTKGVFFAAGCIAASTSYNLLNVIDGFIEENFNCLQTEECQLHDAPEQGVPLGRINRFDKASALVRNKLNRRNYQEFCDALLALKITELNIFMHKKIDEMLHKLKKQVNDIHKTFYQTFARVFTDLIITFDENYMTLQGSLKSTLQSQFNIPIITIEEIQETLDNEISNLHDNMPNLYDAFINGFLDDPKFWVTENPNSISKYVNDYFIKNIFGEGSNNSFANKTISKYLRIKYNTDNQSVLVNNIYNEFITKLDQRSNPLFPILGEIGDLCKSSIGDYCRLFIPETSIEIRNAAVKKFGSDIDEDAQQKNKSGIVDSTLTDRIYMMKLQQAVPISAYTFRSEYERSYFGSGAADGRHLYEGFGGSDLYNDWRTLPSIFPNSISDFTNAPEAVQNQNASIEEAYRVAVENGILNKECDGENPDDYNRVYKLSESCINKLKECLVDFGKAKTQAERNPINTIAIFNEIENKVVSELNNLQFTESNYIFPKGKTEDSEGIERIRKDYFFISPAIRNYIKKDINLLSELNDVLNEIDKIKSGFESSKKSYNDFFNAVFSGVIEQNGLKVVYKREEFGQIEEYTLSELDKDKFKYCSLPLYQAFLNYNNLEELDKTEIENQSKLKIQNASNGNDPAVLEYFKSLDRILSKDKLDLYISNAAEFPEINKEVKEFIDALATSYNTEKNMFSFI